jgi:hypothetical protein
LRDGAPRCRRLRRQGAEEGSSVGVWHRPHGGELAETMSEEVGKSATSCSSNSMLPDGIDRRSWEQALPIEIRPKNPGEFY